MNSTIVPPHRQRYFLVLSLLLALFCCRVLGQLVVALWHVPFLPPMDEWLSGAIPYPALLICQILIIILYGKTCIDFARDEGFFAKPHPKMGTYLLQFGAGYFSVMVVRYIIRMSLYPAERWTGGCIP